MKEQTIFWFIPSMGILVLTEAMWASAVFQQSKFEMKAWRSSTWKLVGSHVLVPKNVLQLIKMSCSSWCFSLQNIKVYVFVLSIEALVTYNWNISLQTSGYLNQNQFIFLGVHSSLKGFHISKINLFYLTVTYSYLSPFWCTEFDVPITHFY